MLMAVPMSDATCKCFATISAREIWLKGMRKPKDAKLSGKTFESASSNNIR